MQEINKGETSEEYRDSLTAAYGTAVPQVTYSIAGSRTVNSTVTIAVNLANASQVYGCSLDMFLDRTILDIQAIKMGTLFSKNITTPLINRVDTSGIISIVMTLSGANANLSTTNGSLVLITAKVKKEGTINLKTTTNLSSLSSSGYTSCIKLSAKNGVKISYGYSDTSFKFSSPLPITVGNYSNSNSNLIYSGSWTTASDSSQKYSNTKDSSLSFYFKGTGFTINSIKANNRGIARVYIDNTDYGTFDNYSANVTSTAVFTINSLSFGTHTAKIVVTNAKTPASSGYYISIKSIDILNPPLTAGTYNSINENLIYSDSWTKAKDSSQCYSNSKDSSLTFYFKGTGFIINSIKANNRGIAKIYVDNIDYGTFDDYSSAITSTDVFSNNNFSFGNHTVKIVVTSSKTSASSNYYISIKSIDILNSPLTAGTYNSNNSNLIYSGSWTKARDSSQYYSNSKDSSLTFSFKGTSFSINSIKSNNRGIAKVYIDNAYSGSMYCYSSNTTSAIVYSKRNLTLGNHIVKILVTNLKSSASSDYYISIKSINIYNTLLTAGTYNSTNSNLIYSGSWTKAKDSSQHYSNVKDSSLTFSFNGSGFTINSIKANNRGIAVVYIDNVYHGTFDNYSANVTTAAVFSKSGLPATMHNVKIIVSTSKNPASTGYYISIKSINISDKK